jgi:hypothetical protein
LKKKGHEEYYFDFDFMPWANDNCVRAGTAGPEAAE